MAKRSVAIVGRPNIGKSTLFNMLVGEKIAITSDEVGVTRDRIFSDCSWRDKTFQLIDTGGIESKSDDIILQEMRKQAELAISMSDVIIFLTDLKSGVTAADMEIAAMLRKSNKKIILACNKADQIGKVPDEIYEFYNLGLGEPYPISSLAKLGIGELLDAIYDKLEDTAQEDVEQRISVAIIGKPNVGKSSLVNKILGEKRTIVSDIAGTTRDAIDSEFSNKYGSYTFIDTAGIRKKSKVTEDIEKYSVIKAHLAIDRADVALILIDAKEGVTDQDEKIAGYAFEKGKALIIGINKWDLIDKNETTLNAYSKKVRESFKFMSYAPIISMSAVTGLRINSLFELINKVYASNNLRVSTSILNNVVIEALAIHQPPTFKGRRLKVYYATEVKTAPPTFVIFVNSKELAHFSYLRYLENALRNNFDLEGTPINIVVREKKEKGESD